MKIILLSTERGWGGGEEQLRLLAEGLSARGHVVSVGCRTGGMFQQRSINSEYEVFALPGHPRGLRAIWHVRRWLARERPDVVHANDAHAMTLMRWAAAGQHGIARIASRRVVFPIRSPSRYVNGADRVLCVSRAIRDVAHTSGIPKEKLGVVYDGIDLDRVPSGDGHRGRASLEIGDDIPLLLVVASLVECKGHRYLLEALPQVIEKMPHLHVILAGEGDQRGPLTDLLQRLALRDRVRLLGFRSDVPDLIQACDLFVLPSIDEGLGTSAIDALVAGKPVVATTSGGLPEVLRNDSTGQMHGWLVPPADATALATAIVETLNSPHEADRRTAAGQAYARHVFSQDAMVDATLQEYADVLKNFPRR